MTSRESMDELYRTMKNHDRGEGQIRSESMGIFWEILLLRIL